MHGTRESCQLKITFKPRILAAMAQTDVAGVEGAMAALAASVASASSIMGHANSAALVGMESRRIL